MGSCWRQTKHPSRTSFRRFQSERDDLDQNTNNLHSFEWPADQTSHIYLRAQNVLNWGTKHLEKSPFEEKTIVNFWS